MLEKHLGDSYDLVKRVWAENLGSIAPMYAHPRFIPARIREKFIAVTLIPILDLAACPQQPYGLFLDPHTGIPLEAAAKTTISHASLAFIIEVKKSLAPAYMICFDQSCHRKHELDVSEQRAQKRSFLQKHGISSFYYVSHAPFLFMASKAATLADLRQRLLEVGIPQERFQ
jgi:hypothetical protein